MSWICPELSPHSCWYLTQGWNILKIDKKISDLKAVRLKCIIAADSVGVGKTGITEI